MASKENPFLKYFLQKEGEDLKVLDKLELLLGKEKEKKVCGRCGETLQLFYSPKVLFYQDKDVEKELTVLNAPFRRCEKCDENTENFILYKELRNVIEEEIFMKLNKQVKIPDEVDLSNLV